ncbi:hypothetical protein [Lacihabitans lacunae]|uniref:Uncharacterized protein n=1 Tax=Lacihabitans lacunae TaxID=1028214 RepID=A0ABV7Z132_9BACT
MKKTVFLVSFLFACAGASAQVKIGNNPTTINANSVLEIESTNKGLLLPRLALSGTAQAAPLSAHVAGMVAYNTATVSDVTPGYYYNDGTKWLKIGGNTSSLLSGATNPVAATGSNGDFYLNTATNTLFGPKASGAWPATGASLVGPAGPAGTNATVTGTAPIVVASGVVSLADVGVTTAKLADGAVTAAKLNQMAATTGQVLKWNGTAWAPASNVGAITLVSSATFTATATHETILCDVPTGGMTLTLPSAATNTGKILTIRKVDEDNDVLTFSAPLSWSATSTVTTLNYLRTLTIQSDGTKWWIITE